jgi:geranylgeranyl reductase
VASKPHRWSSFQEGATRSKVTKCSGEGIYFAAKSGRMCAETIVKNSQQGSRMIDEADLMEHLREWDGHLE